jgi:hypothetical protein
MDMGGPVGGAIDVGIGADDDTVLDDDRASVRNAVIAPPLVLGKTKPSEPITHPDLRITSLPIRQP